VITHRLFVGHLHQEAARQTVAWLDNHDIPYRDLCLVADKTAVGADLYIEDTPRNVEALREAGLHVVVFSNPTNRDVGEPRAASWREAEKMVRDTARPWWRSWDARSKSVAGR
jgi:5'(3')-deoxyribonucleotidase